MLILAIETSSRSGSLALARGGADCFTVLEVVALASGTYSARLIPELSSLLARHTLHVKDLEGFVVVSGPGSFTGLRVGLSTAKGLAEVLRRPVAALSMLEVLAAEAHRDGRIITGLDAGRNEVYAGEYDVIDLQPRMICESLLSGVQFSALLEANAAAQVVTPDPTVSGLATGHPHLKLIEWPHADKVGRLGLRKILAGETVAADVLDANYIGRSDAAIFSPSRSF
jgi:tRNA threonylcarbamoyladenosine biosynthesis protein TsaB